MEHENDFRVQFNRDRFEGSGARHGHVGLRPTVKNDL